MVQKVRNGCILAVDGVALGRVCACSLCSRLGLLIICLFGPGGACTLPGCRYLASYNRLSSTPALLCVWVPVVKH